MQRNFAVFGGEFLMKQNVRGLRGFFDGFFRLPTPQWAGFLAGWPGLPNNDRHETWLARILYGINFLARLPPAVALDMVASIVAYSLQEGTPLLQSVTPFFGEPASYERKRNDDRVGDVAAKLEARRMIRESTVAQEMPVTFEDESLPAAAAAAPRAAEAGAPAAPVESFQ
jgi:lycopene beta-cyclase